nr:FtsQ-type POTRA domain-containing protein [Tessaracoccus coleopterorum]
MIGGIAGGVVALAALLVYLLGFSSLFSTDSVEIDGTHLLTVEQVRQAAAVPMGEPLLPVDTDAIAARVAALAPVLEVHVARALPTPSSSTSPSARWCTSCRARTPSNGSTATASCSTRAPRAPRDRPGQGEEARRTAAQGHRDRGRPPAPAVDGQIRSFSATAVDRIGFDLTGDREVVWGSAEESELKGEVLAALLSVEAEVYDVSAPRNPITRK